MVELRLLGPLEIHGADGLVDGGPPRQRTVLAALALDVGQAVPAETLIDRVWGEAAPRRARHSLHVYIARLRGLLASVDAGPARLSSRSGGYALDLDPDAVDAYRFRRLVEQAGDPATGDDRRAQRLREALLLWRGPLLADLAGDWVEGAREGWHQQRVDAVLAWARYEVRLGRAEALITPLTEIVAQYPLIEPLTAELIRAMHLAGRTADAMDRFAAIRHRLAEHLDIGPGPELRQAYQEILDDGGTETDRRSRGVVPRQLPLDVAGFTGRRAELDRLDALLLPAGQPAKDDQETAVVIGVIAGAPGVGKTALAVRWAHRVSDRFPDGQLYLNLRGYDPDRPVGAGEALARLLDPLGPTGSVLPAGDDERAAHYRTVTTGRRLLVVLDNAASVEQVRPLLPGSSTCAVLVTSRDGLAGLVARDGAHRVDLEPMPVGDARVLFSRLAGDRVDAEPEAAAALVTQCGGLPLAVRVAAELTTSRPAAALGDLVTELSDHRRLLHALDAGGDGRSAVSAVFSWSVRHLPAATSRVFRLLGLHPGPDLTAHAAAALTGSGVDEADRALVSLARAHLVQPVSADRYGMHDLLRAYAVDLAGAEEPSSGRAAAVERLLDYYLATVVGAMDILHPAEAHLRPRVPPPRTPLPDLTAPAAARAWLDAERPVLVAVAASTAAQTRPGYAVALSSTLHRYLDTGYFADASVIHGHALSAARRAGDRAGEAQALLCLGIVHHRLTSYPVATRYLRQALTGFRRTGDRVNRARALSSLGTIDQRLGRYGRATEHHQRALALFRELGDRAGEARALNNLGMVERLAGRHDASLAYHREALSLFRAAGHRNGEGIALNGLGRVEQRSGRYLAAGRHLRQALEIFSDLGNRTGEGSALRNLGALYARLGRSDTAVGYFTRALAIFRDIGERDGQALAHTGLGDAHQALGDRERAQRHYRAAVAIYDDVRSPDAATVRARLA